MYTNRGVGMVGREGRGDRGGRGGRGGRWGGDRGRRNNNHRGRGGGGGGGRWHPPSQSGRGGGGGGGQDHAHYIGTTGSPTPTSFAVAVQGCSHGELDSIYDALESYRRTREERDRSNDDPNLGTERRRGIVGDIDVLLCCGDVQTLRNADDLHSLNVPPKYKAMGDFHDYYSGRKVAPILTIVIGGNHEASNYLQELHYGGWLAPNIYYLGAAGVVNLRKRAAGGAVVSTLRIAGISGIYNPRHYRLGRYETPPYNSDSLRSVYHTREVDVKRLLGMASARRRERQAIDIMISHDWPRGIAYHGDMSQLLQRKPFFRQDIEKGELGSPASEDLLSALRPRYWFAAHLHVKFEALVRHESANESGNGAKYDASFFSGMRTKSNELDGKSEERIEPVEDNATTKFIALESNDGICPASSNMETLTEQMTRFLSLDKCLPRRRHIQITYLEPSSSEGVENGEGIESELLTEGDCNEAWLEYDASWLAMLRRTHGWTKCTRNVVVVKGDDEPITEAEIKNVVDRFKGSAGDGSPGMNPLAIPQNFVSTVPPFDPASGLRSGGPPPPMMGNPQTDTLLEILGLEHCITVPYAGASQHHTPSFHMQPPRKSQPLIPLAVMHLGVKNNVPADDVNEIDLDDNLEDAGDVVANDSHIELHGMSKEREDGIGLDDGQDPAEIDLGESDDEQDGSAAPKDDADGDAVCYSPTTPVSVAKKARTDDA